MWKPVALSDEKRYVLNLCQSDVTGHRFCAVTEEGVSAPDMVLQTEVIPTDLLRRCKSNEISEKFRLSNGDSFVFGAHGEWFTSQEIDALEAEPSEDEWVEIPWVIKVAPVLPPK